MNKNLKSKGKKLFLIGNTIAISNRAYAMKYNSYLDLIKSKKERYKEELAIKQTKEGKGPRPIVVIWSNKYHKRVLAVSKTTSKSEYNLKNTFYEEENNDFWKYEILDLNISTTDIKHNNKIWKRHSREKVNLFLNSWSENNLNKIGYEKIKNLINQYELESKEKFIKELLKNKN